MAFQVGDKVWSVAHGDGVVVSIDPDAMYPIEVQFDDGGKKVFRSGGERAESDRYPNLFHAGTHIVIAPEPQRESRKPQLPQFKPFDRVLVRDADDEKWVPHQFSYLSESRIPGPWFITIGGSLWKQCIPYEGNESLVCTSGKPGERDER